MGHKQDNEVSHDEMTIFTATRSIGQIEVWKASFPDQRASPGLHPLRVVVTDAGSNTATDQLRVPDRPARQRAPRDQDNALEAWPEHGLLGTQLGLHKSGGK